MTVTMESAAATAHAAITNPSPERARTASVRAAQAVLSSPDIRSALSADATAVLGSLTAAVDTAEGAGAALASFAQAANLPPKAAAAQIAVQAAHFVLLQAPAIAGVLASAAGSAAAVGAAASIGAAMAPVAVAIAAIFAASQPANDELAAQAEARAKHFNAGVAMLDNQARLRMHPAPTGPKGENRPADLFAWQTFKGAKNISKCETSYFRPLIGAALMRLTESGLDTFGVRPDSQVGQEPAGDPEDRGRCYQGAGLIAKPYYEQYIQAIRAREKNPNLGIPEDRRRAFRMLRRAIEAQYKVAGTDGGAILWRAYLDLLADEFERGHLTPESLYSHFLAHHDWHYDTPWNKTISFDPGSEPTSAILSAAAVDQLVENWRRTVAPIYEQDRAARAATTDLFAALSRVAALTELGQTRLPAKLLAGIPPAIQKQLGVTVRPMFLTAGEAKRVKQLQAAGISTADIARQLAAERNPGSTSAALGLVVFGAAGAIAGFLLRRFK